MCPLLRACDVWCEICHMSCEMCHVSCYIDIWCVIRDVRCVMCHVRCVIRDVQCELCHISCLTSISNCLLSGVMASSSSRLALLFCSSILTLFFWATFSLRMLSSSQRETSQGSPHCATVCSCRTQRSCWQRSGWAEWGWTRRGWRTGLRTPCPWMSKTIKHSWTFELLKIDISKNNVQVHDDFPFLHQGWCHIPRWWWSSGPTKSTRGTSRWSSSWQRWSWSSRLKAMEVFIRKTCSCRSWGSPLFRAQSRKYRHNLKDRECPQLHIRKCI